MSLLSHRAIIGRLVETRSGARLGTIKNLRINSETHRVYYYEIGPVLIPSALAVDPPL